MRLKEKLIYDEQKQIKRKNQINGSGKSMLKMLQKEVYLAMSNINQCIMICWDVKICKEYIYKYMHICIPTRPGT